MEDICQGIHHLLAKSDPEIVTNVEILEGDGGLGTLLFLQFTPGKSMRFCLAYFSYLIRTHAHIELTEMPKNC